ncbi:MAG: CDP-alcohol phosphatidyltransferase family protein [Phycisphaerales bacterium]
MTSEPPTAPGRRPLETRSRAWVGAQTRALVRWRISPNLISVLSMVCALGAAGAFLAWPLVDGWARVLLLLAAGGCIQLRLLCNMLDGMVAVEGGLGSALGDLFNEVPDRVSDSIILIAMGYGLFHATPLCRTPAPIELGWAAALLAMATAYIRALGAALGHPSCFQGPMAKPHRMALLTAACAASAIAVRWESMPWILWSALALVVVGSGVTCVRRLGAVARVLEQRRGGGGSGG